MGPKWTARRFVLDPPDDERGRTLPIACIILECVHAYQWKPLGCPVRVRMQQAPPPRRRTEIGGLCGPPMLNFSQRRIVVRKRCHERHRTSCSPITERRSERAPHNRLDTYKSIYTKKKKPSLSDNSSHFSAIPCSNSTTLKCPIAAMKSRCASGLVVCFEASIAPRRPNQLGERYGWSKRFGSGAFPLMVLAEMVCDLEVLTECHLHPL